MEKFAVSVIPVADVVGWRRFVEEATTGHRAEDHQEFLRRGGVTAEHIIHQPTPAGDLMILVWEGLDQAAATALMGSVMDSPQSDHERYLRDHVMTELHGLDLSQPLPPPAEHVASARM